MSFNIYENLKKMYYVHMYKKNLHLSDSQNQSWGKFKIWKYHDNTEKIDDSNKDDESMKRMPVDLWRSFKLTY